jgi:hypothetical protein
MGIDINFGTWGVPSAHAVDPPLARQQRDSWNW